MESHSRHHGSGEMCGRATARLSAPCVCIIVHGVGVCESTEYESHLYWVYTLSVSLFRTRMLSMPHAHIHTIPALQPASLVAPCVYTRMYWVCKLRFGCARLYTHCGAVCCSVLERVAKWCSVEQRTFIHPLSLEIPCNHKISPSQTHTHTQWRTHANTHILTRVDTDAYANAHTHKHTHKHTHTNTHTNTHTRPHTHTRTHRHAHTHTYTLATTYTHLFQQTKTQTKTQT